MDVTLTNHGTGELLVKPCVCADACAGVSVLFRYNCIDTAAQVQVSAQPATLPEQFRAVLTHTIFS